MVPCIPEVQCISQSQISLHRLEVSAQVPVAAACTGSPSDTSARPPIGPDLLAVAAARDLISRVTKPRRHS